MINLRPSARRSIIKGKRIQRFTLFFLAIGLVFGLVEPGINTALAISSNNRTFNTDYDLSPLNSESPQAATLLTEETGGSLAPPPLKNPRGYKFEDLSKRTPFSSTYVNNDGSKTMEYSPTQRNYHNGKTWEKIDNNLNAVKRKAEDPTLWQTITNTQPKAPEAEEYTGQAGTLKVSFKPLNSGITIYSEGKTITMKPRGAKNVTPTITGVSSAVYKEAWPNVDIEYELRGEAIKEIIILKNKKATTTFNFDVDGGKVINHPTRIGELTIEGLPDEYSFSALTLSLEDRGVISEQRVAQTPANSGKAIEIKVDDAWFKSQPASSFPMRIDPSYVKDAQTYWMFKSDGFGCNASNCYANVGALYDNGWKNWRTYFQFPFSNLAGKKILNATLHGYFKSGANGDTGGRQIWMGHANCVAYNCRGGQVGWAGGVSTDFDINFTGGLQQSVDNNDWGTVWSLWGEEGAYKTFKPYLDIVAYVTYDSPTPMALPSSPGNGQTILDTQPSLKVGSVSDADGEAVQYYFRVSTNPDAETGAVINSGWIDSPQWTIPAGILQDGRTYYWHAYTKGGVQTNPNWVHSFKVNQRNGKDSTQSYDTAGPVGIDLATGNATLTADTHSISALGGNIGLNLTYNTPNRSEKGLKAEYWNVSSGYNFASGAPSSGPNLTRRDHNIAFDWVNGSPGSGVNNDWFYTRWTGQFKAPTSGAYKFGASSDDNIKITIDGQDFYNSGCYSGICYDESKTITLNAGQVVSIQVNYLEGGGLAYSKLYLKGAVAEQEVPREWLYTVPATQASSYGLIGRYYTNPGYADIDVAQQDASRLMMVRQDTKMSLNFGAGGPAPGMQTDNYMARWTGYITVPTGGSYSLGAVSDDGLRIKIKQGGAWQTVVDSWQDQAGTFWGSATTLPANVPIPIQVDWYERGGGATLSLMVQGNGYAAQEIPTTWLTPGVNALPSQWSFGVNIDGNVSYERLRVGNSSVILEDSTGSTHEYTYTNGGYRPPVNEDGTLSKNTDNTYTFIDVDGRTYIFDVNGNLSSLTSPVDDKQPAALKYEYAGDPSRLVKIQDGVTNSRFATVYYKGVNDSNNVCDPNSAQNSPSTFFGLFAQFDQAPNGMLCALTTSDGNTTNLYYKNNNLARVVLPGGRITDYAYDSLGRITTVRDPLAADVIGAGVRTDNESVATQLFYDSLGRISSVKPPSASEGEARPERTFTYGSNATDLHIAGASEPNGYSRRIEYDSLLRTIKDVDVTSKASLTEWDTVKDLVRSTTDMTGLKSATIYDADDRAIDSYGPAPTSWFDASNKPITTYNTQIPRISTSYDEGLKGFATSWYNLKSTNMTMFGAPKINQLGYASPESGSNPAHTRFDYRNHAMPMTPDTSISGVDGFGIRATGKITFPASGIYTLRTWADDSIRISVDDNVLVNNWGTKTEGITQNIYTATFAATAGKSYRIQVDYGHVGTPGVFDIWLGGAGIPDNSGNGYGTRDWSSFLTPGYNLANRTTVYDNQLGSITSLTQYSNPAYGQVSSTTLDPSGLNHVGQSTYETPGVGYLRQTSKTLPGGAVTTYQHYSGSDTRDNPCTTEVDVFHQAGMPKGKIDPTGRTSESIYNAAGDIIATRFNNDPWTCVSYDARARVVNSIVPSANGKSGRTVTNNYAVNGNPLITSTSDSSGTITVEVDLLGRTTKYTDAKGNLTTNTYDAFSKLTSRTSLVGAESYEYDSYNRLIKQKLDNVTFATVTYDAFSRIDHVDYQAGISLQPALRDSLGRTNKVTYRVSGQDITDEVTRSTSGLVMSGTENGVNKSYSYDKADRLLGATIGNDVFTYGFDTSSATCSSLSGNNQNAGKDGNRTSYTLNGATTTYCYNMADQLIASSDSRFAQVGYDSHGNITRLGDETHKTEFGYDISDRNVNIKETTSSGNRETTYQRDSGDRIYHRSYKVNGVAQDNSYYGFTSSADSPSFLTDTNGTVTQKYLNLVGGIKVTIKTQSTSANATTYSLFNIQGNTMATINADGGVTIIAPNGPFGEKLTNHTVPVNSPTGTTNDYLGIHRKATEVDYLVQPIQMNSRVYIPELGRFLQIDSVEGGTVNAYAYALDPINQADAGGKFIFIPVMIVSLIAIVSIAIAANSVNTAVKNPTPTNITIAVIDTAGAATSVVSGGASVAASKATSGAIRVGATTAAKKAAQLSANKAAGKEAEKIALDRAKAQYAKDYELRTQQYFAVDGYNRGRFADITAYQNGKPVFNIEVKSGNAPYRGTQAAKDAAILEQYGVPTRLDRVPLTGR